MCPCTELFTYFDDTQHLTIFKILIIGNLASHDYLEDALFTFVLISFQHDIGINWHQASVHFGRTFMNRISLQY